MSLLFCHIIDRYLYQNFYLNLNFKKITYLKIIKLSFYLFAKNIIK